MFQEKKGHLPADTVVIGLVWCVVRCGIELKIDIGLIQSGIEQRILQDLSIIQR